MGTHPINPHSVYAGVFDTLDSNNDGVIDEMELNDVILSMYQVRTTRPTQPRTGSFTHLPHDLTFSHLRVLRRRCRRWESPCR